MRSRGTHGTHKALGDDGGWSIIVYDLDEAGPEGINVLSLDSHDLEAVAFESLRDIVTLEVLRRVTGNGDIIIVDKEFNVEVLSDS